jgi:hypothetical protein
MHYPLAMHGIRGALAKECNYVHLLQNNQVIEKVAYSLLVGSLILYQQKFEYGSWDFSQVAKEDD